MANENTTPTAPQLSPALAGKYRCVGVVPGRINTPTHGTVDLTTIGLTTADELVALGFRYLEKIEAPAPSATSTDSDRPAKRKAE